jgi:DNA-binding NarL/FixJ family response regulator
MSNVDNSIDVLVASAQAADTGKIIEGDFARLPERPDGNASAQPYQTPPKTTRILLVDDHPLMRQGLMLLINRQADLTVCGEADDVQSALREIAKCQPDILIVDISLNGPDGLELLKSVRIRYGSLPVLILSMHEESIYAERALRAGANGYIMKQEASETVVTALRRIMGNEIYVSERIANKMLRQFIKGSDITKRSSVSGLSDRELEIFRLIGEGHGTRQIAEQLHLSVKTVESYQAHIKGKLSLRNARELVQHAIQWSIHEKAA